MPSAKPGKGKASYYAAGALNATQASEPTARPGSGSGAWHKGAMSKRFDVKEENASTVRMLYISLIDGVSISLASTPFRSIGHYEGRRSSRNGCNVQGPN